MPEPLTPARVRPPRPYLPEQMKKKLTPDQEHALKLLTDAGAGMTAAATRDAWEKGESYYIDTRNPARGKRGVLKAFNKGNRDAVKVQPRDSYKSSPEDRQARRDAEHPYVTKSRRISG